MTVVEREPTLDAPPADWTPVGHYPDWAHEDAPRIALCGARLLGIRADGIYDLCVECERIFLLMTDFERAVWNVLEEMAKEIGW